MNLIERLRRMADAVPPGGSITLARDWLEAELAREAIYAVQPADLTVSQVCGLLGRRPSTVRAMCARGELRAYRYRGAEWRVPAAAVSEYLARAREGTVETRPSTDGSQDALGAWRHVREPQTRRSA
jgi:excisionase family DNA binding protein